MSSAVRISVTKYHARKNIFLPSLKRLLTVHSDSFDSESAFNAVSQATSTIRWRK